MESDASLSTIIEMFKCIEEKDKRIKEAAENGWTAEHYVSDKKNRAEWIAAYLSLGQLPPPLFMCVDCTTHCD